MPVLGICRGMQVINVAFGGTLLPAPARDVRPRGAPRVPGSFDGADHDVRLTAGSLAARPPASCCTPPSPTTIRASTRSATGCVVTGSRRWTTCPRRSSCPSRRFVLGVQWHPEADDRSRVVGALVPAAAQYRAARDGVAV